MDIILKGEKLVELLNRAVTATDYAETRLDLIDRINSPAIPNNRDVIEPIRAANRELRLYRYAIESVQNREYADQTGINR